MSIFRFNQRFSFSSLDHWLRGHGASLRSNLDDPVTIEGVQDKWNEVTDMDPSKGDLPASAEEMTGLYFKALDKMSSRTSTKDFNRMNLVDYDVPETEFKYDSKDTMLYALGGASTLVVSNFPASNCQFYTLMLSSFSSWDEYE